MNDYCERPVRLIGTDLDGTLLDPFGQISKLNLEALKIAESCGIVTLAVTARSIRSTRKISAGAGIGPLAICQNGAAIYDLDNDKLLSHTAIERDLAVTIISEIREQIPGVIFAIEKLEHFIPEEMFFPTPLPGLFETPVADIVKEIDRPVTKVICRHPKLDHATLRGVVEKACGTQADPTSAGGDWMDFQALGISKASGLALASEVLGIDRSEIASIGDQVNDVPMLLWANYSGAMSNGNAAAKAAANWIAPDNTNDGVAAFISHLLEKFNNRPSKLLR